MRPARLLSAVSVATICCLGTVVVAGPAGASDPAASNPLAPGNKRPLVIANLAPETGELATLLDSLRKPVQIAVDEINAAGGVNGAPVTLVTGDDGTDAATVSDTVTRLISEDGARVVIGPASSPTAASILTDIEGKALMCSGSNSAAELDTAGADESGGLYFRTAAPESLQGAALGELVLADGHSKVAILAQQDSWLADVGKDLAGELEQGGARVVADQAYDPEDRDDIDAAVDDVLAKKPDSVVVLGLEDDGAQVVQALLAAGAGPATLPIYTTNAMQTATFGELVDAANPAIVAGIKGTAPAADPAGIDSPFRSVFAATAIDPIFSAQTYDCTILAALAAVKAKSTDPQKLAKAFTENLAGKQDCNTFAACQALLAKGKSIHWRGASSKFDSFGKSQPEEGVYDVWSFDSSGNVATEPGSSQITIR